jgi:hypothetical protein
MGSGLAEPGGALAQQVPLTVEVAVVGSAVAGRALEETYHRLAERHRRANARLCWHKGRIFLSSVVFLPAAWIRPFPALFLRHIRPR